MEFCGAVTMQLARSRGMKNQKVRCLHKRGSAARELKVVNICCSSLMAD